MFLPFISQKGNTSVLVPIIMSLVMGTAALSSETVDTILKQARDTRRAADVYQVTVALAQYYDDEGQYPVVSAQNIAAWDVLRNALEPYYIQKMPTDPGSYAFAYESDGRVAKIQYYSEIEEEIQERWAY